MEKLISASHSAAFLVRELQELYTYEHGLINILALDLLQDAVKIRDKLAQIIAIQEMEAT